ncbi:MAG: ABC transporter permease [Acidobacteria bacterium]|nr:ABC transporter permease [Acidobacteriota bacterium]
MKRQSISEGIFAALLRLLPFDFQREYGSEMEEVFREQQRETRLRGEKMRLWWKTIVGIIKTAPREHIDVLRQDLQFATRTLVKTPGFAVVALLTLTLGIGANTAIFSVVNAVMLRPFPYPDIDEIMWLGEINKTTGEDVSVSYPNFIDWRKQATVFEHFGLYRGMNVNWTGIDQAERLSAATVSSAAFSAMGIAPVLGRSFTPEEDEPVPAPVAIISERLWHTRLGRNPNVIGTSITLGGLTHTIVGVMPGGMRFPSRLTDVWIPIGRYVSGFPTDRGAHPGLWAVARLKDGATHEHAVTEMNAIADRLAQAFPASNISAGIQIIPYYELVVANVRPGLLLLLGTVVFVLLIACANLANLMLARSDGRQREIALRASLGAGKWRLVRQLLTESFLLASVGAIFGVLLANWTVGSLTGFLPATLPRVDQIQIDANVLAFALASSVIAALLFGLVPAVRAARFDLQSAIREGSPTAAGGRRSPLRSMLIVAELALALVVLVGAGLTVKSFGALMSVDAGFDVEHVVFGRVDIPASRYPNESAWVSFHQELLGRLSAIPAVQFAGLTNSIPLNGSGSESGILPEGTPLPTPENPLPGCTYYAVTPDYFKAIGIQMLKGRTFTLQDNAESPLVAVIDEAMADKFWPNENPIGKRVSFEFEGHGHPSNIRPIWREVIGVVESVKHYGLTVDSPRAQLYAPITQLPLWMQQRLPSMAFLLRTNTPAETILGTIRRQVGAIDSDLPVYGVGPLANVIDSQVQSARLGMLLMGLFGVLALSLAVIGVYGVVSYSVTQRTQEIGIRIALGAQRHNVIGMIVRQAGTLVGLGIVLGLFGGTLISRLVSGMLFGVSPADPTIYAAVAAVLALVAFTASYIPARRATRVDPLSALRYE